MFTLEQIHAVHDKVKSGADFPNYVKDMKALGVKSYTAYVVNGSTNYIGDNRFSITSSAKYEELDVADRPNRDVFSADLKRHQNGETDYFQFCKDCAKSGVAGWVMDLDKNTCNYFDKNEDQVLMEMIPL
jgi:uncharacterized protein YbcV (DUF1398 family)